MSSLASVQHLNQNFTLSLACRRSTRTSLSVRSRTNSVASSVASSLELSNLGSEAGSDHSEGVDLEADEQRAVLAEEEDEDEDDHFDHSATRPQAQAQSAALNEVYEDV